MFNFLKKLIKNLLITINIPINFSDKIALPIVENKKSKLSDKYFSIYSFGNFNKRKIFYVIRRSPGAGLFSNVIYVLNHINIALKHNFTPVVDMENFKSIYNEDRKINNTFNAWEYYFKQISPYKLKNIYRSKRVIITENKFYKSFSHKISKKNSDLFKICKKKILINKDICREAGDFVKKNFSGKVLGIHYRGTSYKISANHPFPPTKSQMLKYCNKILKNDQYEKIFLCTEDKTMFDFLQKNLGNKICFFKKSYRSIYDDAFKIYPRANHRYKLGKEILIETLVLSKCDGLICQESNVSEFLKFMNHKNKLKFYYFNNGYNSSNEYIAMWLWYYKNLAPKFLGGFE